MKSLTRLSALIAVFAVVPVLLLAQKQTRTVYVTALDQAGAPVTNLTAADFEVKEGDAVRPIVYASPMTVPMRIILLLDNSGSATKYQGYMKAALTAFIDTIPAKHEIGIVNMGRVAAVKQAPTTDREKLKKAAGMSLDLGGIVFFDAMREVEDRFMKKEGVKWPVYVMFVGEGNEASTIVSDKDFAKLTADMTMRGTVIYAAGVQTVGPTPLTDLVMRFTQSSGGMFVEANTALQAPVTEKFKTLADRVMSDYEKNSPHYQIEYTTDAKYTGSVDIRIVKDGIKGAISMRRIS